MRLKGTAIHKIAVISIVLFLLAVFTSACVGDNTETSGNDEETPPDIENVSSDEVIIDQVVELDGVEVTGGETEPRTPDDPDLVVEFPDGNLELAIRQELGIDEGPLTAGMLAGVEGLGAPNMAIGNLEGLQYCINIKHLFLGSTQDSDTIPNYISDITPLADLTMLEGIDLQGNHVTNLEPLRNLTNLTALNMSGNGVENLDPLGNLVNLEDLLMLDNDITDISPLAGCTSLKNLWLQHNKVSNLEPLRDHHNLEKVYLDGNFVTDITPLVENADFGEGCTLSLLLNNLTEDASTRQAEILRARGVTVIMANVNGR